jgi:HAD superfamily hydrolase (TIGR01509 family)
MIFKGVLIDFGGTLAYLDEVESREYEEALVAALKKYGHERRLEDVTSVLADIYYKSSKGELKALQEFWNLMLAKLKIPEQSGLTDIMQGVRNTHETRMYKMYDKIPQTLSMLQKKYKLALVSNCAVGTDRVIRSLGLSDFFDCIILSYQVGVRKPNKRLYLEALKCLGLEADKCVFVADEISDLEGAREIGLKTILVLQGHSTFQEAKDLNFKPDFQITKISEVTKIL